MIDIIQNISICGLAIAVIFQGHSIRMLCRSMQDRG